MLTLVKKDGYNDWIEVGEGTRLKVDYPTRHQSRALKAILFSIGYTKEELEGLLNGEFNLSEEKAVKSSLKNKEYMEMYLKFSVKDWEGVNDKDGNPIPCTLKNNELEDSLWNLLCDNLSDIELESLYSQINEKLEFSLTDKKK